MIELLIYAAGAATGVVGMMLPMNRVLHERDMLQVTKDSLARDVEALKNRATTLRGDNLALQAEVANLTNTNVELQREVGRNAAEMRAATANVVKRDPATGRFLPNPNAKRPRASRRKPAATC